MCVHLNTLDFSQFRGSQAVTQVLLQAETKRKCFLLNCHPEHVGLPGQLMREHLFGVHELEEGRSGFSEASPHVHFFSEVRVLNWSQSVLAIQLYYLI